MNMIMDLQVPHMAENFLISFSRSSLLCGVTGNLLICGVTLQPVVC